MSKSSSRNQFRTTSDKCLSLGLGQPDKGCDGTVKVDLDTAVRLVDRHGLDQAANCVQRHRADFWISQRFRQFLNLAPIDLAQLWMQPNR